MPKNQNIELRNEEVQEILTKLPHWMIRWGNLIILMILAMIFFFSYLIKYPEIVTSRVMITTPNPPEKLYARTSGKIKKIFVENKDTVQSGTALAIIENTADYRDVFLLKSKIDSITEAGYTEGFYFPFDALPTMQLGQIQNAFILFQNAYLAYDLNRRLQPLQVEKTYQGHEAASLEAKLSLLKEQKEIQRKELDFKKNELKRYAQLYENGIISTQEWERKQIEISQAEKQFKNLLLQIVQLESSINMLDRNVKNTLIQKSTNSITLLRNVLQAFNEVKTAIANWELSNVLRSSISGQVSFMDIWSENQNVNAGELVFIVVPTNIKNYIGKATATSQNSGKIKVGQEVKIHLDNYPDHEYGVIVGEIASISLTPDANGNLLIDIALPHDLETSYHKTIEFYPGMTGTASIITEDLRLIERLLYQFRDIFKR